MLGIPFLDVAIRAIKPCLYDDLVDRLNYLFTSWILMFFALMVSAKQYFGKPIQCWLPAEFKGGWEQYVEDYCFVQNTYFIKEPEVSNPNSIQLTEEERKQATISYYQWVPIVLVIQALMFYLPQFFWKSANRHCGINVKEVLKAAEKASACQSLKKSKSDEDSLIPGVACYLEDSLAFQNKLKAGMHCHSYGMSLTLTYLATKVLFFLNIIIQFFMMNSFLGSDHSFWGLTNLSNLMNGVEWEVSGMFPRVTYCEFGRSHFINYNKRTVQCVLMVNMFNEKIYIILWFWFFVLAVLTGFNLIYWAVVSFVSYFRQQVVMKYLRVAQDLQNSGTDRRAVARFTNRALRMDGVLVLRFISGHVGDMVAMELTYQLWKDYIKSSVLGPSSLNANGQAMVTSGEPKKQPFTTDSFDYADEKALDPGLVETLYEVDGKKSDPDHVSDRSSPSARLLPSAPLDGSLKVSGSGGYPGPPPRLSRKTTMM